MGHKLVKRAGLTQAVNSSFIEAVTNKTLGKDGLLMGKDFASLELPTFHRIKTSSRVKDGPSG